jgi:hypothetical protein
MVGRREMTFYVSSVCQVCVLICVSIYIVCVLCVSSVSHSKC